jgi:hypothetical protein
MTLKPGTASLRSRAAWLAGHRAIERPLLATGYALAAVSPFNALLVAWTDVRYALLVELGVGGALLPIVLLRLAWIAHKVAGAVTE